ncbi:DUF397 domain-containing protein [Streptomyces sp. NPDC055962]|uniref:DUF397 domain-containing protein n=1 Tax=unclassified Streptomyces TaxID=2593676 RepID=UPI0035DC681B
MPDLHWVKSSFSDAGGNNCVEVAAMEDKRVAIRESDSPDVVLIASYSALHALVLEMKSHNT